MGKRTGRRRGAPDGNKNRLVHGGYSAEAIARRRIRAADAQDARLLHDATALLLRVDRLENVLLRLGRTGLLGES